MSQENVELFLRIVDAWNRRDVEAVVALWTPKACGVRRLKRSRRGARIAGTQDCVSTSKTWRSSPKRATSSTPRFTTLATECSAWVAFGSGLPAASSSIRRPRCSSHGATEGASKVSWLSHAEALEAVGLRE